jgi:serine/threonine protein kinase
VYRAVDTKLEREVAIKVLPAALAGDPERLVRFEREAKHRPPVLLNSQRSTELRDDARRSRWWTAPATVDPLRSW